MGMRDGVTVQKRRERADEAARAIARIGVMTYAQIGRLLGIPQLTVERLVAYQPDIFTVKSPPKSMKRGRYEISNRIQKVIGVTKEALAKCEQQEKLQRVRSQVSAEVLPQTLKVAEVLVGLKRGGELYTKWDVQLPMIRGLHAELIHTEDPEQRIGVFVQPDRLSVGERSNAKRIMGSITRQVAGVVYKATAYDSVSQILFLCSSEFYYETLDALSRLDYERCYFYAVPYDAFIRNPSCFLESIVHGEKRWKGPLLEYLNYTKELPGRRGDYFATVLIEDRYRMVDVFCNGSADKVRQWLSETKGVPTPDPRRDAVGRVYVENETMRAALEKILSDRRRHQEPSIVEVYPWPEGMDDSSTKSAVVEDDWDEWNDEAFWRAHEKMLQASWD